jgi:3-phosphoshikimate 1-carboxyvinyltransferase
MMGIKTILKNNTLKIYGNPKLKIKKEIKIKNYYKDHRIFMTSVIGGLVSGGKWTIHDVNSYRSSFPSFMNILRKIGFNATYR